MYICITYNLKALCLLLGDASHLYFSVTHTFVTMSKVSRPQHMAR